MISTEDEVKITLHSLILIAVNLKRIIAYAVIGAGCIVLPTPSTADTQNPESGVNPVEKIVRESEGNVIIDVPDDILQLILKDDGSKTSVRSKKTNLKPGINKVNGFRIQVFSDGSHQSSLESRARARGSAIVSRFPKYRGQIYSFSSSPNWYTRVGNFKTSEEASAALMELKRAFPQFAGDMRVVKSQIVIIK